MLSNRKNFNIYGFIYGIDFDQGTTPLVTVDQAVTLSAINVVITPQAGALTPGALTTALGAASLVVTPRALTVSLVPVAATWEGKLDVGSGSDSTLSNSDYEGKTSATTWSGKVAIN